MIKQYFSFESSSEVLEIFNSRVRPYDRISNFILVSEIPLTDLGKVKYQVLRSVIMSNPES